MERDSMDSAIGGSARPQSRRARARHLTDQLRAVLERQIDEGRLRPGERLATERELAFQYGASRNVVRSALAELHKSGKITRHVGRGTLVAEAVAKHERAIEGLNIVDTSPAEMMEFRMALEPGAASAIVLNATERDLQAIVECVERGDAAEKWEEFEYWDHSFHRRLIAATHNRLMVGVYEAACATRFRPQWGKLKQQNTSAAKWLAYQSEHRRITEALLARDASAAENAIRAHLGHVRAKMLGY
jgi:DNA-binding FadR family transcriptional regulator